MTGTHNTWDPLLGSRISLVDEHGALNRSAAGSSQLLVPVSGTPWRKRRHQHHHWRFSVNIWDKNSSDNLILFLSSDL